MIEKLNMQAIISASSNVTEYVKDALVTFEKVFIFNNLNLKKFKKLIYCSICKMPILINELIVTELWKKKIFKELIKMNFEPKNSFVIYFIVK